MANELLVYLQFECNVPTHQGGLSSNAAWPSHVVHETDLLRGHFAKALRATHCSNHWYVKVLMNCAGNQNAFEE